MHSKTVSNLTPRLAILPYFPYNETGFTRKTPNKNKSIIKTIICHNYNMEDNMNQEKQAFINTLSELRERREKTNRKQYDTLIEETEILINKYSTDKSKNDIGDESLSELYFFAAESLFKYDLAIRAATHTKTLANEEKTLKYYNKAIELYDIEEYTYGLWDFLSTAGHREDGIAALEHFIERTGGTAKVLSRAAEYILMYADSEDKETIQKSLDYFYRAIELEPDRYETYWAFFTDLEEAVDVCPQLFKEAVLCLNKLIELSLPEDSENHDTLGNRYFDLTVIYTKMNEYEKALETAKKGFAIEHSDYGNNLIINLLFKLNRFEEAIPYCKTKVEIPASDYTGDVSIANAYFDLAHCYHMANKKKLASKYYLLPDNAKDIVPKKYEEEYLIYYKQSKSPFAKLKKMFVNLFSR